ncbi:uncharacterized protein YacL [Phyllobacterium ifriqiyense]
MLGWLVRLLFIIAGTITGWFVATNATNFIVLQMFVMLGIITIFIGAFTFFPIIRTWFRRQR